MEENIYMLEDFDFNKDGTLLPSLLEPDTVFIVIIKAEWCGHCKTTTPKFIEAANKMKDIEAATPQSVDCAPALTPSSKFQPNKMKNNEKVKFCIADITGERESQKAIKERTRYLSEFRGFPDIRCFKNGKEHRKYKGNRSAESFMDLTN